MVRPDSNAAVARMVELRAVQEKFPFYGKIVLQDGVPYSHDLLRGQGVLVRPDLLMQFNQKVGDRLMIGGRPFTIRGVISKEPGRRAGAFSLGSRVMVDYADLKATGLLSFGSRANEQVLLRVAADRSEALARDLRQSMRDRFVNVRSYRATEDQIGEELERAENYLSLVGFIIVVLGGIGVWSVTRVFVRQKIRSVAILKCLGATVGQVLATYVLQVVLLGLTGSLLGVVLAAAALSSIPASLTASLGDISYGLTASAVLQGLAVGLLVSLLFALVPLLEVRRVKPLLLIRGLDALPGAAGSAPSTATALDCRLVACHRLDAGRRDVRRQRGTRLRRRVAGGVAPRRCNRVDRLCRGGSRAASGRRRPGACGPAARARALVSACGTPSSACDGPATRRASSCSPSGWAASSCSASARCSPA